MEDTMGFIHLLHVLVALSIVYITFGLIVAAVALAFIAFVFTKLIKAFSVFLLAILLIASAPRTVYAQAITDKQFAKEIEGIVRQDKIDIDGYQYRVPANVTADEAFLYVTLVKLDLSMVSAKLHLFKHHHATRSDVDQVLGQLLLDLEHAPGAEDLKL